MYIFGHEPIEFTDSLNRSIAEKILLFFFLQYVRSMDVEKIRQVR